MTSIDVLIYSYKNKNLESLVKNIIDSTSSECNIAIKDQNNMLREDEFSKYDNVSYQHIVWDLPMGPGHFYKSLLKNTTSDYILILSDDVTLMQNWDLDLIEFLSSHKALISGNGTVQLSQKDLFSFEKAYTVKDSITKTQWVNRSFIFFKRELLDSFVFQTDFKYYGFEEAMSLELIKNKIDIYCATSKTYTDSFRRNIENIYVTFSREHWYNNMIDRLESGSEESITFKKFHGISSINLKKIPYQTDDVMYNYYDKFAIDLISNDGKKYTTQIREIG